MNLTVNFNILINFKNILAPYIECYRHMLQFFETLTTDIEFKGYFFKTKSLPLQFETF